MPRRELGPPTCRQSRAVSKQSWTADRDLWTLLDVASAHREGGLEAYLLRVLGACQRWFDASSVSLFLRNDWGDYVLAGQSGASARVPAGAKLKVGDGIAGACIASGSPMLIGDPAEHPLLAGRVAKPRGDVASSMVVPLLAPDADCLGVLNVSRGSGEPAFSNDDLVRASSLAGLLALAAGNARLVAQLNTAVAEARGLHGKLHGILNGLGVGVVVVSPRGRLQEFNPQAADLLEAAEGVTTWSELVGQANPNLRASLDDVLAQGLAGSRSVCLAKDPSADLAWSVACTPLPGGSAAVVLQDATALEKAERELSRVNRLAEIGQMTAAIAHEIRNPLTGIRSAAQMVASSGGDSAEFGQIIEEEANKLNALCDEFLDFARPLVLHVGETRVADVVRRIVMQHRREAQEKRLDVRLDFGAWEPVVRCDPRRFEQVCRNLLLNAIDASKPGGTVRVLLDDVGLAFEDDGPGIDPANESKLFTPFFTTKANGTGLGLSTVRKIAEAHGWQVSARSRPGSGARFEISFYSEKAA